MRIREKMPAYHLQSVAYVSIRQHTSAYVSIRQHSMRIREKDAGISPAVSRNSSFSYSMRQHTSAYVSIRQHTSAYVSIAGAGISRAVKWYLEV
jgi:hypothetical protein